MRADQLNGLFGDTFEQTSESRRGVWQKKREIDTYNAQDLSLASANLQDAFMRITTRTEHFRVCLDGYENRRTQAAEYYRSVQAEHGVRRPALKPDVFMAIYITAGFAILEGTAAGFLMVGEGHTSFLVGIALGLIFGFLNVFVAVAGGFFGLRNMFWKINAPDQEPQDVVRRAWGRKAFIASLLVLALLLWTAMRTRALGSHTGIFSFHEVGLWETFDDGLSIALLVLGGLGGLFGYWKGYCGFSDPIPGYTKARRDVDDTITDEVADAAYEVEEAILDIADEAEDFAIDAGEAYEDSQETLKALIESYAAARDAHNDQLNSELLRLKSDQDAMVARRRAIARRDIKPLMPLDLEALEALKIPETAHADPTCLDAPERSDDTIDFHLNAVRDAKSRALADIRQAVIAFEANTPDLSPVD